MKVGLHWNRGNHSDDEPALLGRHFNEIQSNAVSGEEDADMETRKVESTRRPQGCDRSSPGQACSVCNCALVRTKRH